jgi:hypothetical protein
MERFVKRQNIERYQRLLGTTQDEQQRQQIQKLLAEEQQQQEAHRADPRKPGLVRPAR